MEVVAEQVGYFSSDFNCNSLIYSTKEGSVLINGNSFTPDRFKKDVKYYPPDECIFTTTDASGLRVWDSSKQQPIYSYRKEEQSKHSYSPQCILGAAGPYSVNFYDLRCRYSVHTLPKSRIARLGWVANSVYLFDGENIYVYDYRMQQLIMTVESVLDFAVADRACFLLQGTSIEKRLSIIRTSNAEDHADTGARIKDAERTVIDKRSGYDSLFGVKCGEWVAGVENKKIKLQSFDRAGMLPSVEDAVKVKALYLSEECGYLFMKDSLYKIDRNAYGL